ncbi:MAG: flagellar biosynthesis protein FlhA [Deltaproteobacteria bacterium]|nr:flagellar biosynthesis protein FlhA [Deltaproteobacteria bacterium]
MSKTARTVMRRLLAGGELAIPAAFVVVVIVMVIPLPTPLLDLLLTLNVSLSLIILLVAMYTVRPLEFSTFPSVLLVTTLFRLSLNVASTRLILLHGEGGSAAAGHVIQAFGNFVVGGSYVVGIVVFLILVVINFAVITKGAGRIAEVAARFTLDAMPGKQLAVDAELNAGLLSEKQARERRRAIEAEADFYGAMDGASKFVRGDAVAGLLIAAINIVGGLFIGIVQRGLAIQDAAEVYTVLTIGDGLVSQLPALLISTAAGIIVTRAASGTNLGTEVVSQLLFNPRVLSTVAVILGSFAILPGLPFVPFLVLAGAIGGLAYFSRIDAGARSEEEAAARPEAVKAAEKHDAPVPLDLLELEVGYELVPLVDGGQRGELTERIRSLRRQLAQEMGFVVPPVHIRDNLQLKPAEYAILLKGVEIARGEVRSAHYLAINPGGADPAFRGIPTKEPAFGLDALWVPAADREQAQLAGYTVVDVATVIVTHLTELIRRHAHELLGRQEVQGLLDGIAKTNPKVVEELVPQQLSLGGVQKVLQNLLREHVSIRDLLTIVETLADHAPQTKDPLALTEQVRQALSRSIVNRFLTADRVLPLVTLAPRLEKLIAEAVHRTDDGTYLALEPSVAQRLLGRLGSWSEQFATQNQQPLLLCSTSVRGHLRRLTERFLPSLALVAPGEIPANVKIHSLGVVSLEDDERELAGRPESSRTLPPRANTPLAAEVAL